MNHLYFGDNLRVLREHVASESVDLIYLDPPFNSNASYNVLFRAPDGSGSGAQIEAFGDSWQWGEAANDAYYEVLRSGTPAAEMLAAMRGFLGENAMMAYLAMMAVRLIELHRVLKPTGSLYLHCDPTASHYLKLLLDAIFGARQFRNEIVWKRTSSHNDAAQGLTRFGRSHDVVLFYSKQKNPVWNLQYAEYSEDYKGKHYRNVETETGRNFKTSDLTAAKPGGDTSYEWKGVPPPGGRYWAYSKQNMERFEAEGRLVYAAKSGVPRLKHYLDDMPGVPLGTVWTDIWPINSQAQERLGYPTQKPVALLERIIAASSNPGDVVLDPFCGCGTTIHAAEKLGREWIGIDVTHLSIALIRRRLREAFPGIAFDVHGTPTDYEGARALADQDKHQFELWAISLIPDAQPHKGGQKGADQGIDGVLWVRGSAKKDERCIIEVKGGKVGADQIRSLKGAMDKASAPMGIFVTLEEPTKPMRETAASYDPWETDWGPVPRLQIVTIRQLLESPVAPIRLPAIRHDTHRKAVREERTGRQKSLDL